MPFEVTIITNLTTVVNLHWYNTYAGLAVPFLATGFGAFLLRQAFLGVPGDLRDAAALDGYGHFRFMVRVAVPLSRPAMAALAVECSLAPGGFPMIVRPVDSHAGKGLSRIGTIAELDAYLRERAASCHLESMTR